MSGVQAVRFLTALAALAALAGGGAGCSSPAPWAAEALRAGPGEDPPPRGVLSGAEQARVLAAMRGVAGDHEPVNPPRPALHGVRWSDVHDAAGAAAAEVEMVVIRRHREQWEWRFELRTIEDRPAELIVRRAEPPLIYSAEASVGRFGDDERRAAALLTAFDEQMRRWGSKRNLHRGGRDADSAEGVASDDRRPEISVE